MQTTESSIIFFAVAALLIAAALMFLLKPMSQKTNQKLKLALAIVIPAVAASLYMAIGSPAAIDATPNYHDSHPKTQPASQGRKVGSVDTLLRGLEERLEKEPDDVDGWLLLAQSYQHVGRDSDADRAYAKAKELGASDARLKATGADDSGRDVDTGPVIRGTVSATESVRESIGEDDVVFVFAKETREHRMPVAAIRRPASSLPFDFALSNADVMIKDTDISRFETLFVTARLSRSGMATDREGALEAWSEAVEMRNPESADVQLVLAEEVVQ